MLQRSQIADWLCNTDLRTLEKMTSGFEEKKLAIANFALHIKAVGLTGTIRVKCLIKVTRLILVTWMPVRVFPTHVKSLWSNNQIYPLSYYFQVTASETCCQYVEASRIDWKSVSCNKIPGFSNSICHHCLKRNHFSILKHTFIYQKFVISQQNPCKLPEQLYTYPSD